MRGEERVVSARDTRTQGMRRLARADEPSGATWAGRHKLPERLCARESRQQSGAATWSPKMQVGARFGQCDEETTRLKVWVYVREDTGAKE
jgi:hypothetical protein